MANIKDNIRENQYDLRNYRADNKKLRVYLPGEFNLELSKKKDSVRDRIEAKRLDAWVKNIKAKGETGVPNVFRQTIQSIYKEILGATGQKEAAITVSDPN